MSTALWLTQGSSGRFRSFQALPYFPVLGVWGVWWVGPGVLVQMRGNRKDIGAPALLRVSGEQEGMLKPCTESIPNKSNLRPPRVWGTATWGNLLEERAFEQGRQRKEASRRRWAEAGGGVSRTIPPSFSFHCVTPDSTASVTLMHIIKITIDVSINYNLQSDYIKFLFYCILMASNFLLMKFSPLL